MSRSSRIQAMVHATLQRLAWRLHRAAPTAAAAVAAAANAYAVWTLNQHDSPYAAAVLAITSSVDTILLVTGITEWNRNRQSRRKARRSLHGRACHRVRGVRRTQRQTRYPS